MSSNKTKYISTEILTCNDQGISRAVQILKNGGTVAFPTETVYGLGADATNSEAIEKVYQAKGRPKNNPLIIHVKDKTMAEHYVEMDSLTSALSTSFWPGPLTVILKKKPLTSTERITEKALSKLKTVAIRVPAHPVARQILCLFGKPIAAPSANLSGKLSTTRFEDVVMCLSGKVDAIVDGGPCPIGVESTILTIENGRLTILRPGKITEEEIKSIIGKIIYKKEINKNKITSPGQFESHYCPETPIRLNVLHPRKNELVLAFGPLPHGFNGLTLSKISDPNEAAMNLYSALADLDNLAKTTQSTSIAIHPIPLRGIGIAINDRLRRAAKRI